MSEKIQPLVDAPKFGDHSPQANASAHVGVGMFLAIAAFGISCVCLGIVAMIALFGPQLMDAKVESTKTQLAETIDKARTSENHWRNDEVDIRNLQSDVKKLNEVVYAGRKH